MNWAEVSRQLEQELQSEQAQRQAHHRVQPRFRWAFLREWIRATRAPRVAQGEAETKFSPRSA